MRILLVTAANEAYKPLLQGLVQSLQQWLRRPFTDLACFDLGLSRESRAWVERHARHVVEPAWDLPVDPRLRMEQPELRALTVRPFLPRYFPGYDTYVWIDSDAWVQEHFALEWYVSAASRGELAVTPEVSPAYQHPGRIVRWRSGRMQACFGPQAAQRLHHEAYFNAGVFALAAGAGHWDAWAKWFGAGLSATKGKLCCDQTALNHALWAEQLPVNPLPALCNWLCHLALPRFDALEKKFCEPLASGHSIGIIHLSGNSKDAVLALPDERSTDTVSLRFPNI